MIIIGQRDGIRIDTRRGKSILNSQSPQISSFHRSQFKIFREKYPNVTHRSEPSGYYNCHGLVFASRRAEITKNEEVSRILEEDDYVLVKKEKLLPGDVILYYSTDRDLLHSGIVVATPSDSLGVPTVISKWGSWREVLHPASYCPYDYDLFEFYRINK